MHVLDIQDDNYILEERPVGDSTEGQDTVEYGVRYEVSIKKLDGDKKLIKYCASQKAMAKFNADVEKYLSSIGALATESNPRLDRWSVDTQAGPLEITLQAPEKSGIFSIFTMFEYPEKAKEIVSDSNPYSGKWNFHMSDAQDTLDTFMHSLDSILVQDGEADVATPELDVESINKTEAGIVLKFNGFNLVYSVEGELQSKNVHASAKPYTEHFGSLVKEMGVSKLQEVVAIKRLARKSAGVTKTASESIYGDSSIELSEDSSGNLVITVTDEGREEIKDAYDSGKKSPDDVLYDIFEGAIGNGFTWIAPETIGALTDAPIIGLDVSIDDDGYPQLDRDSKVWWYPEYQISDPMEDLAELGTISFTFTNKSPRNIYPDDEANKIAGLKKKAARLGNYDFDVHGGQNWELEASDDGQKIKRIVK